MSTPSLKSMLERYVRECLASQDAFTVSSLGSPTNPSLDQLFPGCIAFIAFYKRLTGDIEPDLDDLTQNIAIGFIRLLKEEVPYEQYIAMSWDLREWLGWLYENAYTWIDLGVALEAYMIDSSRTAA